MLIFAKSCQKAIFDRLHHTAIDFVNEFTDIKLRIIRTGFCFGNRKAVLYLAFTVIILLEG